MLDRFVADKVGKCGPGHFIAVSRRILFYLGHLKNYDVM